MENKKRKILYISGTRADYGLIREVLLLAEKKSDLSVEIAALGMHLMPEFGLTINEIKADGLLIHPIKAIFEKDDRASVAKFIGQAILGILTVIKKTKPDFIFVQGDRPEMLAGAIAGVYSGTAVCHSHGGEVTLTVDEIVRHAISKLVHLHFAATEKSAQRLEKMGEDSWRIFKVGAPGLDAILRRDFLTKEELAKKYFLDVSRPLLLVLQHPVTTEINFAGQQIKETMEAIEELNEQAVVVYPNSDPGSKGMIKVIEKYRKNSNIKIYPNILHHDFLSLMKSATLLIGNSSSGLVEAPSFALPAINIGTRQTGREKAKNVIDVGYNKDEITKAARKVIWDENFKQMLRKSKNPYGDGKAGQRIIKILSEIPIDGKLLQKQITY
jgi:GDP/UDP-N,N'-diacetylbacillosamine 2-epimerase (hydrolysing)